MKKNNVSNNINFLINKKANKKALTKEEIYSFISMIKNHEIPDYKITAMITAIYINGMDDNEIFNLTMAMRDSGNILTFDKKNSIFIDKHSTGGVGDKITLIIAPLLSSLGLSLAKISGRGLGHTGGTIDKLNSVGINTNLSKKDIEKCLKKYNFFVSEQTNDIVPTDSIIYALRNDINLVDSMPLIVSSIMSKKLSLDVDKIYLDVKVGSGGFFKNLEDAKAFSKHCVKIGKKCNKSVICHITNMDIPLGKTVGNKIEFYEAISFLDGNFLSMSLKDNIYSLITDILIDCEITKSKSEAEKMINNVIESKKALNIFKEWAKDNSCKLNLDEINKIYKPKYKHDIMSNKSGYLKILSTKEVGYICLELGGGRLTKTDSIDFEAGIYFHYEANDKVKKGDTIITLYSSKKISNEVIKKMEDNVKILSKKAEDFINRNIIK